MIIMINKTGWLTICTIYFGTLNVTFVMLLNSWQKYIYECYEHVYIMPMRIMHARMFQSKL